MRETQEGCPLPLKSIVFETFSKFQKLSQRGENTFSTRWGRSHAEQEGGTMEEKEQRDVDDMIYVDEWRESQR